MKKKVRRNCPKCKGLGWYYVPVPSMENQSYRRVITHLRDDGRHSCTIVGCLGHLHHEELRYLMGWSGSRVKEACEQLEKYGIVERTAQHGTGGRPRRVWHLLSDTDYLEDDTAEDYRPEKKEDVPALADYLTEEQNAKLALSDHAEEK